MKVIKNDAEEIGEELRFVKERTMKKIHDNENED